jgi:hypothetical protein
MKSGAVGERGGDYTQRFTCLEKSLSQGKNSEEENTRRGGWDACRGKIEKQCGRKKG